MVVDLGNLGKSKHQLGEEEELVYQPLPILELETALMAIPIAPGLPPMPFIRVIIKDLSGEKPQFFEPSMAKMLGEELIRLADAAPASTVAPDSRLAVAQINPDQVMKQMKGSST
jgi:hypothetical protein